jgi:hypothetical protein
MPNTNKIFTSDQALEVAEKLGVDLSKTGYDLEQFRHGMDIELEHGTRDPSTNVTNDDPLITGKIALAHLSELPDYYIRLDEMEDQGVKALKKRAKGKLFSHFKIELDRNLIIAIILCLATLVFLVFSVNYIFQNSSKSIPNLYEPNAGVGHPLFSDPAGPMSPPGPMSPQ